MTSTLEQTKPTVQDDQATDESRWLWHNPKSISDLLAALQGQPYTAACGHPCRPPRAVVRMAHTLSPMERCQVCADLVAGGWRIELS